MKVVCCQKCHTQLDVSDFPDEDCRIQCPVCGDIIQLGRPAVPEARILDPTPTGMIRFACPYCGQHHAVDLSWNKPTVPCDGCRKIFSVAQIGKILGAVRNYADYSARTSIDFQNPLPDCESKEPPIQFALPPEEVK